MPFQSKAQARWAFATKQPFAEKWAHATPDIKALPQHVRPGHRRLTQALARRK